jgi:hypothetical protein
VSARGPRASGSNAIATRAPPASSVEVARLQALQRELDGIEGWLSHRLEEPQEPRCEIAWTAGELKARLLDQMQKDADEAALKSRLASLPPPSPYTSAELQAMEVQHAAHDLWQERLRFERLHPSSPFCRVALHQMSADWLCLEAHDELDAIGHRLSHADHHVCPNCQHRWPADVVTVARLAERRTELLALIDSRARPAQPGLSPNEIKQHLVAP